MPWRPFWGTASCEIVRLGREEGVNLFGEERQEKWSCALVLRKKHLVGQSSGLLVVIGHRFHVLVARGIHGLSFFFTSIAVHSRFLTPQAQQHVHL